MTTPLLIDEFRRVSEGRSLGIIKFSDFMGLFGADEAVIEEVRKEESQIRISSHERIQDFQAFTSMVENSVFNWLAQQYGESSIEINNDRKIPCDFVVKKSSENHVAVEVKAFRQSMVIISRLKEWKLQAFYALEKRMFTEYMLIFVLSDNSEEVKRFDIKRVKNTFAYIDVPNFSIIFGVLKDNQFVPIDWDQMDSFLTNK